MPRQLHLSNRSMLSIEDTAFASGGEGDIYRIVQPASYKQHVVKIYKPSKRSNDRAQKIKHLIANPPLLLGDNAQHKMLIWASDIVFERDNFVGFLMPIAQGIKLEMLCQSQLPKNLSSEWQRLAFGQPDSQAFRLKLCYNIALAVSYLHRLGEYALIDLKPDNILVQSNGNIALIDMDSIAIFNDNHLQFAAPVVTPDFAPPEYYKNAQPNQPATAHLWDRFSLAIIFYRLLCGIHPFVGTCAAPLQDLSDICSKVERGLFVNGKNKAKYAVVPPPHRQFEHLPLAIQQLFTRCFDQGHDSPTKRPSPDEWHLQLLTHLMQVPSYRSLPSQKTYMASVAPSKALIVSSELDFSLLRRSLVRASNLPKSAALLAKISQHEQRIKHLSAQLAVYEVSYNEIRGQFAQQQARILQDEQKKIARLNGFFRQKMLHIDRQAAFIYQQESLQLAQLEAAVKQQIDQANLPIQQFIQQKLLPAEAPFQQNMDIIAAQLQKMKIQENNLIQKTKEQYEQKILKISEPFRKTAERQQKKSVLTLERKLNALSKQRDILHKAIKKEKDSYMKVWQQDYLKQHLAHYRIADYAHSIFNDAAAQPRELAALLAKHGIVSAADFDSVSTTGNIKLSKTGRNIKIKGIGGVRAANLSRWYRRIKDTLIAQIPLLLAQQPNALHIEQKYAQQNAQLLQSEKQIMAQIAQQKQQIFNELYEQRIQRNRQINALQQALAQQLQLIEKQYQRERLPLEAQLIEIAKKRDMATQSLKETLAQLQNKCAIQQNNIKNRFAKEKKVLLAQYDSEIAQIIEHEKLYLQQQIEQMQQYNLQQLQQMAQHCQTALQTIGAKALPIQKELREEWQQLNKLQ